MAATTNRFRGVFLHIVLTFFLLGLTPRIARAVLVPLVGKGHFPSRVEVINRWRSEDRLDVLVLVEVDNADLAYDKADRGLLGRLNLQVTLEGPDGETLAESHPVRTRPLSEAEASSSTLFQRFGAIFEDVPFRSGRLRVYLRDVNRVKPGLLNQMRGQLASSECTTLWYAENTPRADRGIALEDPLFLSTAPLEAWNPDHMDDSDLSGGFIHDYSNPARRFGLTADHLQLYMPVWPPAGGIPLDQDVPDLRVQITNLDMDFVVNDTIVFDKRGKVAFAAGRPAGVFYSLDMSIFPEGLYRLNLAPLGGFGRGVLKDIEVVWQLGHLGRSRAEVIGTGRMVFHGGQMDRFLAASPAEQDGMLDDFWAGLDTDPADGVNVPELEFRYRLAYVRQFLGGFGEFGAYDARGEVFLLLGPPDEVQAERLPMNERDQEDALVKVFRRFAPDREGAWSKGSSNEGTSQPRDPYDNSDGIPLPSSVFAQEHLGTLRYRASLNHAFELWKYDGGGQPLFVNRFAHKGMGQRFLFVDRSGSGEYELESSNLIQGEE